MILQSLRHLLRGSRADLHADRIPGTRVRVLLMHVAQEFCQVHVPGRFPGVRSGPLTREEGGAIARREPQAVLYVRYGDYTLQGVGYPTGEFEGQIVGFGHVDVIFVGDAQVLDLYGRVACFDFAHKLRDLYCGVFQPNAGGI